jgi:hypothetical protein
MKLPRFLLPLIPALLLLALIPLAVAAQTGFTDGNPTWAKTGSFLTHWAHDAGTVTFAPDNTRLTINMGAGAVGTIHAHFSHAGGELTTATQYRRSTSAPPQIQIYNTANTLVHSCSMGLATSVNTHNCNVSLAAGTYKIVINRMVSGGSYFELHQFNTSATWLYADTPPTPTPPPPTPTPPPPPVTGWPSCHVVYNPTTREIYTSTLSLDDAQAVFFATGGSVANQSANLLRNGDFEIADGDRPRNWIWNQPFYAGGMYVTDPDPDYNKIIRRNGSPGGATPLMAGDETPETAGDTLSSGGIVVELSQNVTLPPSDNYQLSADVRVEGGGLILAVGAVQIAPTSAISSFTTISTTAPISDGIRTARIAFDESANTLAIDNVALIPLDSSGGVNCAAVGEYHVANAGTFGGGGGGGGGGWGTFWGIEMGTCVYCQLPEFNTGMEPALTNEYIVAFIWEGVVWLWTLLQAFLCLFLNFVTCILWRLVAIIYNIFMASYAAIMLVVNLAIGWFQWLLEGLYAAFLALMYFYIDVWVIGRGIVEWFLAGIYGAFLALMQFNVDVWVGGRNIIGWLIDGTVTGFWNLAQWSVNTTAYAIQYLAYMLMYSLGGVGYLWQFLLWVMATLWGGVMFILSSLWGFSSLVLTISNTLWGIITAIGEVLSRDPQGIEEWAQNTDLNSFALAMFFLGIKFYDWSMATLRLISAIYLVLGIYGIYVGIKVLKEWDRILPN